MSSQLLSIKSLEEIGSYSRNTFLITDENLWTNYSSPILELVDKDNILVVSAGEASKSMKRVEELALDLIEKGVNRESLIVAFGGGMVSDFTGFLASTLKRGVDWEVIPTTLLAMVDASIGGKTGVNIGDYKNQLGRIHFPKRIFFYPPFLETLPESEKISGLGEMIKYALLEKTIFQLLNQKKELSLVIKACAEYKTKIVESDPFEKGLRALLNLGHTYGHAIESLTKAPHGQCVWQGLNILVKKFNPNLREKLLSLGELYGLEEQTLSAGELKQLNQYIVSDKKISENHKIKMIVPRDIGKCEIVEMNIQEVLL